MSERKPPGRRAEYRHFLQIPTRWMDNDAYGHVNNVAYLSFVDTAANRYLLDAGGLDYHHADVIGLVAETHLPLSPRHHLSRNRRGGIAGRPSWRAPRCATRSACSSPERTRRAPMRTSSTSGWTGRRMPRRPFPTKFARPWSVSKCLERTHRPLHAADTGGRFAMNSRRPNQRSLRRACIASV